MSIKVFSKMKWPVHSGVLVAYGKSNSGEIFQIAPTEEVFCKSRMEITSLENIEELVSVYDTYFMFNEEFMFQISTNEVALGPDLIKDIKELLEFLDNKCYFTSLAWAIEAGEWQDVCKCLVTTAPGPSETLFPVVWYNKGEFTVNPKFTADDLKEVFTKLENQFPAVDLDNEYNKRFQDVNLLGGSVVFNRNHYGHNGKAPNASMLKNVLAGIVDFVKDMNSYEFMGVAEFINGASDYFVIKPKTADAFSETHSQEESTKQTNEDKSIKGKGPLPQLDAFHMMAGN